MKKYILKIVVFTVIFMVLFQGVSKMVTTPSDYRNYQWIAGFYEEPKNSLDAVYFGSSNCYAFWNSLVAWEKYGLTVYPYSCNRQSFLTTEYLIKEARKTQPDALFIVNVNTINDLSTAVEKVHHLLDYMPFSLNKLELINYLAEVGDYTMDEKMELYFPILRYHDRWSELVPQDFSYEVNGLKGASNYSNHLKKEKDITSEYYLSDETAALPEVYDQALASLLDYCDEEKVKILFVTVPRGEENVEVVQRINRINEIIESRGYPTLYMMDKTNEIGIDLTTDYYNSSHTNVHGSVRYTQYLSEYLIENYGFENKRGDEAYSSWEEGWEKYEKIIAPYVLDIERDPEHRVYDLAAPSELNVNAETGQVTVSWKPVAGADGYAVYRKQGSKGGWMRIAETAGENWVDISYTSENAYSYTVVPFREEAGENYYGKFKYAGVTVTTK